MPVTHTVCHPRYHAAMSRPVVLFVSKGESASSTRYRALNYFPLLRAHDREPRHMTDDKSRAGQRRILRVTTGTAVVVVMRRTQVVTLARLVLYTPCIYL